MKKILLIVSVAIATLNVVSCNKSENDVSVQRVMKRASFTAVSEQTKAAFTTPTGNTYPVLWTSSDLSVALTHNYGASADVNVTKDGDAVIKFEAEYEHNDAGNTFVAISPAASLVAVTTGSKRLNIQIPSGQTPSAASPDESALILYAKASYEGGEPVPDDIDIEFKHLTGYLHLKFKNYEDALEAKGATVQSVSITADADLAGRMYFFPETGATSSLNMQQTVTASVSSLEDVWLGLAPVNLSGKEVTFVVNTDKGTITKVATLPAGREVASGKIAKLTVNLGGLDIVAPVVYKLVTDPAQLHVGDKVIIAAANYDAAISTTANTDNIQATSVVKGDGVIQDPSSAVEIFELEDGTAHDGIEPDEYVFKASNGEYLYAAREIASSTKNLLRKSASISPAQAKYYGWKVQIQDGQNNGVKEPTSGTTDDIAYVIADDSNAGLIRYNPENNAFSAYATTTSQTCFIRLYRLDESADATPRFKASMPEVYAFSPESNLDVYVFGNVSWTASATNGATLSETSGTGPAKLTLTVPHNTGPERTFTVTVSTEASVGTQEYTFTVTQCGVGTTLWEEWWQNAEGDELPSSYCTSGDKGTIVFRSGSVTYEQSGSSTKLKADGLVYYTAAASISNDNYRYNLLIAGNGANGTLTVKNIPCTGVKTATLTYRTNSAISNTTVTSNTDGVEPDDMSSMWVRKLDAEDDTKKTYTVTCPIRIEEGKDTFDFTITNKKTGSSTNIRVDGLELVVTEVY